MIKTRSLLAHLAKMYPQRLAKLYHDYVGLMVGNLPENINSIYLTLDLEKSNLEEAISLKPDLIITHHPFIYGSLAQIKKSNPEDYQFINEVAQHQIAVYSMHTNFDAGTPGMNDALAQQLDLVNIKPLLGDIMARGGQLKAPMAIDEFASYAKKKLNANYGLLINEGINLINSVAIIGGGGSRSYHYAQKEGYDIYLSGDAPHHVRRSIVNDKYNYLDLPHEIESIFIDHLTKVLLKIDPSLIIYKGSLQKQAAFI